MKKLVIVAISVIVFAAVFFLGYSVKVSAQEASIPAWIKKTAQWWSQNQTSDSEFLAAIQYLIDNDILHGMSAKPTNQNMSDTSNQNAQLVQKINDLQRRYDTLQSKYDLLLEQVKNISTPASPVTENNDSILAVAVKPVIESDGFFETTTYQGSILKITVEIRDGTGLVLINTALPAGVDFQSSARTAVSVAQNVTGMDLSKKDVIFSINSANDQDLQAVDGPSAGGAMTVLLISDLLGKPINSHILMTGTIQPDGTIGPIGAASDKADAAGQYGAKIFLVPKGQAVVSVQNCTERNEGPITYQTCTVEQKPLSPITQSKYGMQVIEVATIQDALKYFNSP
ncbi:MAG TPA: S16 family serine protease [Candidatus Nitrosotalea sp.]|nr:S16 family serine protease [Candidatus Nitrosotalea sp.]